MGIDIPDDAPWDGNVGVDFIKFVTLDNCTEEEIPLEFRNIARDRCTFNRLRHELELIGVIKNGLTKEQAAQYERTLPGGDMYDKIFEPFPNQVLVQQCKDAFYAITQDEGRKKNRQNRREQAAKRRAKALAEGKPEPRFKRQRRRKTTYMG